VQKSAEDKTEQAETIKIPSELPLLPVRDIVVFPSMIMPLFVGRRKSIRSVDEALSEGRMILLVTQKNPDIDAPEIDELYSIGTIAVIMRLLKLPDGRVKILVQGIKRARVVDCRITEPYFRVLVEKIEETDVHDIGLEVEAVMRTVRSRLEDSASLGKPVVPEVLNVAKHQKEPGRLADLVVTHLNLKVEETQDVLEIEDHIERLKKVAELIEREIDVMTVQNKIQKQAKNEMDKDQKEYFLRQQLKAIQGELGQTDEKNDEIQEFRKSIEEAKMPEPVEKEALKQLGKLERMHVDAAEAGIVRNYLEWLVELPWSSGTEDMLDINKAKEILDEDHYGMDKIKERILEYLSVRKLNPDMKGPILCFVGPPGVGKTSLGKSIARALGRKFVRISLGGVRDEAEMRGHRRTYIGAMPGKIINGLKQAGTDNPVFMMDEVDKIGADFRGDPSAALLEILDPEQNNAFVDHYIGVPFDLSKVLFITTANQMDPIAPAFRDRMEVLTLSGYTEYEKLAITKQYIVDRQIKENGISEKYISFSENALLKIITEYTREAGLRNLEREVGTICRKVARQVAEGKEEHTLVSSSKIPKYLGKTRFVDDSANEKDEVGTVTGLAWTPVGGDIIKVEVNIMKGKGSLILTGSLGDVMKESAQAALTFIRSKTTELSIPKDDDFYEKADIHMHVPAGAIPKDGPSAGITIAIGMISAISNRKVRHDVAMTGEITLRGKILPIGGVKEKVLAAKRAKIKTVILPSQNVKDLDDIPQNIRKKMEFISVDNVMEIIDTVFVKEGEEGSPSKKHD